MAAPGFGGYESGKGPTLLTQESPTAKLGTIIASYELGGSYENFPANFKLIK
jgi:hypothetical protein